MNVKRKYIMVYEGHELLDVDCHTGGQLWHNLNLLWG